jgi:hypothetical protein
VLSGQATRFSSQAPPLDRRKSDESLATASALPQRKKTFIELINPASVTSKRSMTCELRPAPSKTNSAATALPSLKYRASVISNPVVPAACYGEAY